MVGVVSLRSISVSGCFCVMLVVLFGCLICWWCVMCIFFLWCWVFVLWGIW